MQDQKGQPTQALIWMTLAIACLNCGHVIKPQFVGPIAAPPQDPPPGPPGAGVTS